MCRVRLMEATTAGDFVVASTSNAGDCHDAGATRPAGVQVLGRVESTNSSRGDLRGESGAGVSGESGTASVFGRTGAITAQSGDYSVGQITGAAALASPGLTGTPTAPTAAASTNTYADRDHCVCAWSGAAGQYVERMDARCRTPVPRGRCFRRARIRRHSLE